MSAVSPERSMYPNPFSAKALATERLKIPPVISAGVAADEEESERHIHDVAQRIPEETGGDAEEKDREEGGSPTERFQQNEGEVSNQQPSENRT